MPKYKRDTNNPKFFEKLPDRIRVKLCKQCRARLENLYQVYCDKCRRYERDKTGMEK